MTYAGPFRAVQELLDAWPDLSTKQCLDGTARRFRDALLSIGSEGVGCGDITTLARQIILEAQAQGSGNDLYFPKSVDLPNAADWKLAGCHAMPIGERLRITAEWWCPSSNSDILGQKEIADIREISRGELAEGRRTLEHLDADPFWQHALGYPTYVSMGQRQAARSVVTAPPGSTTIVCLPTGHGKTAVIQAPILLDANGVGVSVVVVPTVVLALDMERRFRELMRIRRLSPSSTGHYAYTGEMPDAVKAKIRDDIRQGTQRVIFTSPEALATSLRSTVEVAARQGNLRYFVIDEAHLVEQWGNEFRPEFQSISHLHRRCLELAPTGRAPVTVAMSATLTTHQIDTLTQLFGHSKAEVVWAAQLRHEPSYYVSRYSEDEDRVAAVLEAVTKLPKPMILYVSIKEHASRWANLLHKNGIRRTAIVTGDNDDHQRRDALEGWSGRAYDNTDAATRYDIVIGTSAFGVGVDLSDVRSVLQACLPETIDRYYQEVGRGGRDGLPCISYLQVADSDIPTARSLGQLTILTSDTAFKRWNAMYDTRSQIAAATFRLDTNARAAHLSEGYRRNRTWNIRLLNLMTRAGLVEFDVPHPSEPENSATAEEREAFLTEFYERYRHHLDVTILDRSLFDTQIFANAIDSTRQAIHRANALATNAMLDILTGSECVGTLLSRHYAFARSEVSLSPSITCRGCPNCRRTREPSSGYYKLGTEPYPPVAEYQGPTRTDPLTRHRGSYPHVSLRWSTSESAPWEIERLLRELIGRGVRVVGGPGVDHSLICRLQRELGSAPILEDSDNSLLQSYSDTVVWVSTQDNSQSPWPTDLISRLHSGDRTYVVHSESDWETRSTFSRDIPFFPSHSIATVLEYF
ncbi:protein DpdF [Rhodococcus erythropolis]